MNEIEKRLAEELGFSVTRNWHGGDDREPRIEWTDGGYDITHPKMHDLWRKCCELMRERDTAREALRKEIDSQWDKWVESGIQQLNDKLAALQSRATSLGYTKDQRDKLFGEDK